MAEPIEMHRLYCSGQGDAEKTGQSAFGWVTRVGPRNHTLDGVHIPQGEEAIFGGCPAH